MCDRTTTWHVRYTAPCRDCLSSRESRGKRNPVPKATSATSGRPLGSLFVLAPAPLQGLVLRWVAGFALALTLGCSSNDLTPISELPQMAERSAEAPPTLPFRLAIAPITRAPYTAAAKNEQVENEADLEAGLDVDVDVANLGRETAKLFTDHQLFHSVVSAEQLTNTMATSNLEPVVAADRNGADLLMRIHIDGVQVRFAGLNSGLYVFNWANWFMFYASSWWIADERYEVELRCTVELISVRSEQVLLTQQLTASALRDLDDFDRGLASLWILPGFPYLPGLLDAANLRKASEVVMPFCLQDLQLKLIALVDGPLQTLASAGMLTTDATELALVVGVSRYKDSRIAPLRYAATDAVAIASALHTQRGLPEKNITVLTDADATATRIRNALGYLGARTRPNDRLILYFAGYGAATAANSYLLPFDANGIDPTQHVELSAALATLTKLPAKVVVLLDAAASGGSQGRSHPLPGSAADLPLAQQQHLPQDRSVAIVCASSGGEGAQEVANLKHGLFTYHLLRGLRGEARVGSTKPLWAEAIRFSAREVANHAQLEGNPQHPLVLGTLDLVSTGQN